MIFHLSSEKTTIKTLLEDLSKTINSLQIISDISGAFISFVFLDFFNTISQKNILNQMRNVPQVLLRMKEACYQV